MNAHRSTVGRIVAVCGLARVALAAYLVLRWIFGPRLWPLNLIEPGLIWLCLPSFAFLAVALARRRWLIAATHALIAGAWALMFGHLLVPPDPPPPARGATITLLSFNVGAGVASFEQIVHLLRDESADVVLLQELTADQQRAFAGQLVEAYPHRDLHGLGIEGLGFLSKHPILEAELFHLGARRPYQRARIDFHGEPTTIYNVHPGLLRLIFSFASDDQRDMQRVAASALEAGTAIIAGDFNATENMDLCRMLEAAGLQDAFRVAGRGFGLTFPTFGKYRSLPIPPMARIDFVWHTNAFSAREARVLADAGSDHLPLKVVLERR